MAEPPRASRVRNSTEIIAFVSVVVADAMGLVPITQTIFLVPLVWIFLRLRDERWSTIGFERPENLGRAIVLGILAVLLLELLAVLLLELLAVFVTTPGISALFGVEPDHSALKAVQGNLKLLFLFLCFSWVIAAFGEEICFRGFLMQRLAQLLGERRAGWTTSLLSPTDRYRARPDGTTMRVVRDWAALAAWRNCHHEDDLPWLVPLRRRAI